MQECYTDRSLQNYLRFREPFQSISHLVGGLLGLLIFLFVFQYSNLDFKKTLALTSYQLTFLCLFFAVHFYHGRNHRNSKEETFFEKLDYACIFLFIAGSYTPICFQSLDCSSATWILSIQWFCAILGAISIAWTGLEAKKLLTVVFLVMGWTFIIVIPSMIQYLSNDNLLLLFGGAIFYSVGATIFSIAPLTSLKTKSVATHSGTSLFFSAHIAIYF